MAFHQNDRRYKLLNITELRTKYGEMCVVNSRSAEVMMSKFEEILVCENCTPKYFSSDPGFRKPFLTKYLRGHKTIVKDRPARAFNTNRRESNAIIKFSKRYLKNMEGKTKVDIHLLVARTSFLTNIVFGRSKLAVFQLARGYLPVIAGMTTSFVSEEIMDAHFKLTAYIAI